MNIENYARGCGGATFYTDKHGAEHLVVIVKVTLDIVPGGECVPAIEQEPLVTADRHYGDAESTSVVYETDYAPPKPELDVLLNACAYAPRGSEARRVGVSLRIGGLRKRAVVFGDRKWRVGLLGFPTPTRPKPFTRLPLLWERAFGGADTTHPNPRKHVFDRRNLVGVGVRRGWIRNSLGAPLPNIERAWGRLRRPWQGPAPIGFGVVSRAWLPRADLAGTYDQRWLDERFPFLPTDFDERYFQSSPADQRLALDSLPLDVELRNLSPEGRLSFTIPRLTVPVRLFHAVRREIPLSPVVDTIVVEPERQRCLVVSRISRPIEGKLTDHLELWIGEPSRGRQIAKRTGKQYLGAAPLPRPAVR